MSVVASGHVPTAHVHKAEAAFTDFGRAFEKNSTTYPPDVNFNLYLDDDSFHNRAYNWAQAWEKVRLSPMAPEVFNGFVTTWWGLVRESGSKGYFDVSRAPSKSSLEWKPGSSGGGLDGTMLLWAAGLVGAIFALKRRG